MTPAQKQTTQYELLSEKKVMEQLERSYQKALEDVKDRLRQLDERTDEENRQAVAYQKAFQQGLQKQLERILGKLHSKTYRTVQEYLQDCYLTGHTAVLYELQSDGLRLSLPIPQDKVCQAAVNDTKLVKPLYDSIGEDFAGLKKHITDIVSAGFASGASYGDMANQITGKMIGNYATMRGGALGRAKLIVRTEGNRIANAARLEAARTAKQQGADLVKQWDSTMDKKTRPHHVQLDGQVRELDEPFEVDGRKAQAPGKFGIASEDINCRCHAYSRPRWAVRADSDYKYDNQHRALVKVSSESYAAYRAGYVLETAGKPDGTVPVPAGHAVEVTPPATKGNGGSGKTYRAEKIGGKALTSGADSGIIKKKYKSKYSAVERAERSKKAKTVCDRVLSQFHRDASGAILDKTTKNASGKEVEIVDSTPLYGKPNSIIRVVNSRGGVNRNYYDANGNQFLQISNNGHGNPVEEDRGFFGEHAHDYSFGKNGELNRGKARELTKAERAENGDML